MRIFEEEYLLIPVLRLESGRHAQDDDERIVADPILSKGSDLRGTLRRIPMNSVQFSSPVGVLFGKKKVIEELCIVAEDGHVASLRRQFSEKQDGLEWREKSYGTLIDAGRKYLIDLLSNPDRKIEIPQEVLSACSLANRTAEFNWSTNGREDALNFFLTMSELGKPRPKVETPKEEKPQVDNP